MPTGADISKMPQREEIKERWGKGASDLSPEEKKIDPKVGFILAASLPLSLIVLWKVTIPLVYFCISTALGAELLQKINFLGQDVVQLLTSPCPPWISAEDRAFLDKQDYRQVKRFQKISKEELQMQVDKGEPFVLMDAMTSKPSELDCTEFVARYPQAEYLDLQIGSYQPLKYISARSGYKELDCASGEIDITRQANAMYKKEWLELVPASYDGGLLSSARSDSSSHAFIHIEASGLGTPPYVEESCMNFMAAQISGVTAWSFSKPIVENNKIVWSKPVRLFLQPGEVLIWFPSMRYHREAVDGCSLSSTLGFQSPAPVTYLENLQRDLSSHLTESGGVLSVTEIATLESISKCSIVEENGRTVVR